MARVCPAAATLRRRTLLAALGALLHLGAAANTAGLSSGNSLPTATSSSRQEPPEECRVVLKQLDQPMRWGDLSTRLLSDFTEACVRLEASKVWRHACTALSFGHAFLKLTIVLLQKLRGAEEESCRNRAVTLGCRKGECHRDLLQAAVARVTNLYLSELSRTFTSGDFQSDLGWLSRRVWQACLDLLSSVNTIAGNHIVPLGHGSWACADYTPLAQQLLRGITATMANFTAWLQTQVQVASMVMLAWKFLTTGEPDLGALCPTVRYVLSTGHPAKDWPTFTQTWVLLLREMVEEGATVPTRRLTGLLAAAAKHDLMKHSALVHRCWQQAGEDVSERVAAATEAFVQRPGADVEDHLQLRGASAARLHYFVGWGVTGQGTWGLQTSDGRTPAEHAQRLMGQRPPFAWGSAFAQAGNVRLYVHAVPACAGVQLLEKLAVTDDSSSSWDFVLAQLSRHLLGLHRALLKAAEVVELPEEATLFYVPAFFKLLFEMYAGQQTDNIEAHLGCILVTWNELDPELLLRNAGYDHILLGSSGNMCSAMECDISRYHPSYDNMIVLLAGDSDFGHPDDVFQPGGIWPWLQRIFVPYSTAPLDCEALDEALTLERDVAVALVCTANSRARGLLRAAVEDPALPFWNDTRLQVLVSDSETTYRAFQSGSLWELYRRSVWCLVPPGNLHDLTYRFYDVVRLGCLPVVTTQPPLVVSAPFVGMVDFASFAHFAHVDSKEDAARLLQRLLDLSSDSEALEQRRLALRREVPRLFLEHSRCPEGMEGGGQALLQELALRQRALAHLRFVGTVPTL